MCGIWLLFKDNKINIDVQDKELLQKFFNIQQRGPDNTTFYNILIVLSDFTGYRSWIQPIVQTTPYVYNNKR